MQQEFGHDISEVDINDCSVVFQGSCVRPPFPNDLEQSNEIFGASSRCFLSNLTEVSTTFNLTDVITMFNLADVRPH